MSENAFTYARMLSQRFFTHPPIEPITCDKCEPWDGNACRECVVLWCETVADNAYAEAM